MSTFIDNIAFNLYDEYKSNPKFRCRAKLNFSFYCLIGFLAVFNFAMARSAGVYIIIPYESYFFIGIFLPVALIICILLNFAYTVLIIKPIYQETKRKESPVQHDAPYATVDTQVHIAEQPPPAYASVLEETFPGVSYHTIPKPAKSCDHVSSISESSVLTGYGIYEDLSLSREPVAAREEPYVTIPKLTVSSAQREPSESDEAPPVPKKSFPKLLDCADSIQDKSAGDVACILDQVVPIQSPATYSRLIKHPQVLYRRISREERQSEDLVEVDVRRRSREEQ